MHKVFKGWPFGPYFLCKDASCLACWMIAKRIPSQGYAPLRSPAPRPWTSEPLFLLGKCANCVRKEDGMDHEIVAMWVQTLSSVVGLGCIVWGLFAMQ